MRPTRQFGIVLAALVATCFLGGKVRADLIDLTTVGATGTEGTAIFQQMSQQPTGTGVIQPFLRLQNTGVEQGYNTSGRPIEQGFDSKTDPNFTRNLMTSEVPVVNINGINYRQFGLDINEINSGTKSLLSLDKLQIFQSATPSLTSYASLGTPIYDLGNNTVLLDYSLNHGSGSGDMFAYIPDSLFNPATPFVYLYSQFGALTHPDASADAGFEEWFVTQGNTPPVNEVPAPATLVFAGLGCALGLVGYARGKRRPLAVQA